jgi:hypothetical protein
MQKLYVQANYLTYWMVIALFIFYLLVCIGLSHKVQELDMPILLG